MGSCCDAQDTGSSASLGRKTPIRGPRANLGRIHESDEEDDAQEEVKR